MKNFDFEQLALIALANHFDLLSNMDGETLEDLATHEGDNTFSCEGEEFVIYRTLGKARSAAKEQLKETLWAFNSEFLSGETELPVEVFEAIVANDKCEDNNPVIEKLIEATCGMDTFLDAAIDADGVGHVLSHYDGDEVEIICPITSAVFYAYRVS